jgi:hypothetical protein
MDDRRLEQALMAASSQQAVLLKLMSEMSVNIEQIKQQLAEANDRARQNTDAYAAYNIQAQGMVDALASLRVELANLRNTASSGDGNVKAGDLQAIEDGLATLSQTLDAGDRAEAVLANTLADPQVNGGQDIPPQPQPIEGDPNAPTPINVTDPGIVATQQKSNDLIENDRGTVSDPESGTVSPEVDPNAPVANRDGDPAVVSPMQDTPIGMPASDPNTAAASMTSSPGDEEKPLDQITEADLGADPDFEDDDNDPSTPPVRKKGR